MKLIKNLILGLLIFFNFTGCFGGGVKLKSTYNDKNELKNDILNALHTQYGIEFEVQKPQNGQVDSTFIKGKEYGFIDYLVPKEYIDLKEQWLYIYRTVCDNIGTFDTQAHVYMFEKQLRTDVDEILTNIDKYLPLFDINKFRDKLHTGREKFINLSLDEKKDTILQVLNGLHDNAVMPKIKSLGLSTPLGFMQFSSGVPLSENAKLIYQSPTGLFEKRVKISDL